MQADIFLQALSNNIITDHTMIQTQAAQKVLCVPLTHLVCQRMVGEDAQTFLQGQLSSDLRAVAMEACQYSSYSTPKGRMLASFLVLKDAAGYYLQTSCDIAPAVFKRLNMFIMRSKVQSTVADVGALGLLGPHAGKTIQNLWGVTLDADQTVAAQADGLLLVRHGAEHYQIMGDAALLEAAYTRLQAVSILVGTQFWDAADIQTGYARISANTQEAFVPQMANMDLIGAVSFKKGCYPGQEIVARTQYLGKLKKRAYRAQINTTEVVKNGDAVYSPTLGEQSCGMIALAACVDVGVWNVLVVVQQSCVTHEVFWGSLSGHKLQFNTDDVHRLSPVDATEN